jgi:hypothetical protein
MLITCKKQTKTNNMPDTTNNPVINTKMLEGKFQSLRVTKDTIEFVFVKQIDKDINEYTLKGIHKALSYYLKPVNTLEDKDYTIQSQEVLVYGETSDKKICIYGDSNGNLSITCTEITTPKVSFKKI